MSPRDEGGPAFPRPDRVNLSTVSDDYGAIYGAGGMTLRQWYAGQALPAVIAGALAGHESKIGHDTLPRNAAIIATRFADALIAELEKR